MIGIAILGAGRIAQVHANAIGRIDARLVSVYDLFEDAAHSLAGTHGGVVAESVDDVLGRSDVDAVIIATPTDTHVDYIVRCARAGKSVLCEKPLALSTQEAQSCIEQVGDASVTIQIGFNRRFDPSHAALQQALAGGEIGALEQITITSRDPAPPPVDYLKRSGGLFKDMTIHDFDMARWLLGEEPSTIYAHGSVLVDPGIGAAGDIDTATVVMTTASGRQCTILNSRRAVYGYDQRIEVHGSSGMLISGNHHETSLRRFGPHSAGAPDPLQNFFLDRYAASYQAELVDFVAAVRAKHPGSVGLIDGLEALRLAELAQQSMEQKRVVSIGEEHDTR